MIPRRELEQLRAGWSLDLAVIEKDYVLGWLLAGIAQHPQLGRGWVFKGGTCLRKCYYETFRFSEDLDFTVTEGGLEEPEDLRAAFSEVADWLREESGIEPSTAMPPPSRWGGLLLPDRTVRGKAPRARRALPA